jgi:signal transduction histidine kinase
MKAKSTDNNAQRIDDALRFVAQRGWSGAETFLAALARYLGETFAVDYVVIDRLSEVPGTAETVALYAKGAIVPNIRYCLAGTPCDNVVGKKLCYYPSGVQGLFPQDTLLVDMRVDSYIGVPLWDSAGICIGLIAMMDSKPFAEGAAMRSVLQIVATTAAAELQREHSLDTLLKANAELERFAAVASHDLQEPVRTVVSFAQMLEKRLAGQLDDEARELLGFIVAGAKRMRTLVGDLAEYTHVISRKMTVEPLDMGEVVDTALGHLQPAIAERGARITAGPLPSIPGDRSELVELFRHLIDNAIKFTAPGQPPTVRIEAVGHNHHAWMFSVADTGMGIAPQYREKVFVIFQRLHTGDYPGNGVGLAVCKRIVERHGGNIWVESTEGKGTTVFFTLPKERSASAPSGQAVGLL